MKNHCESDISTSATEHGTEPVGGYSRKVELQIDGLIVGERLYELNTKQEEYLALEKPLRNGRIHGRMYTWDSEGQLDSVEPYIDGLIHGSAHQFFGGRLIGSYHFEMGSGCDLWWTASNETNRTTLTEARFLVDGQRHGFEWWINEDEQSVYQECHFCGGIEHGIRREWDESVMRSGFPRFFLVGLEVSFEDYEQAAASDTALPRYCAVDDRPARTFPPLVTNAIQQHSRSGTSG